MTTRRAAWKNACRTDPRDLDFLKAVHYEATRAGLDPRLVPGLIQVESGIKKYAASSAGARSYMQLMPFWVQLIGTWENNLFHLRANLRYGCTILRLYLDIEKSDLYRSLGRYNGSLGRPGYPRNPDGRRLAQSLVLYCPRHPHLQTGRETPRILKTTEGAHTMQKFYLVWDESRHALGIPSLDRQHREMMDLVNELAEAVAHGCDYERAHQQMEKILDFVADHFAHEEILMRQHDFPGAEQHAAEHEKLLREAATLMETYDAGHADRAVLVTAFLTDCAENHILNEDREISQYFRERGIKAD